MAEELQYLDSLNSKNTLFLIRQPSTGRILTGRRVDPEQMAIYARIQQQEIPHVPFVRDIIQETDGHKVCQYKHLRTIGILKSHSLNVVVEACRINSLSPRINKFADMTQRVIINIVIPAIGIGVDRNQTTVGRILMLINIIGAIVLTRTAPARAPAIIHLDIITPFCFGLT